MADLAVIATLTLVFAVAAVLLLVTSRASLPVIPFYLLSGIAIGWAIDEAYLIELAQWGIAFLVFAFAVEIEPLGDPDVRIDATVIGVLQIAVTGALLYFVGVAFGLAPLPALYVAIAGGFSSTLIALGHLQKEPVRPTVTHERLGETIHFVEDLVAVGVVLLLSALVYADEGGITPVAVGIGLVAAAVLIRLYAFERIAAFAEDDVEVLMLTGVSMLIGFIALAEATEISIVVGAFAAGLAVPHEYPHDVDTRDAIGYLEDFFVPIFFVTLGALVTFPGLETLWIAFLLYLSVVAVNPAIVASLALLQGYDSRSAVLTAVGLDQVSEFALIIAIEALLAGVLARELFDAIALAAVASMITSTYTTGYGSALYQRFVDWGIVGSDLAAVRERSTVPDDLEGHLIVVGYGPLGRQVVEACGDLDCESVVVETDPALVESVRTSADYHVQGDALSASTWEVARPEAASLVVSTVPDPERTLRTIREAGDTDVIVHPTDPTAVEEYLEAGALFAAVPEVLAGEHVGEQVRRVLTDEEYRETLTETGRQAIDRALSEQ